MSATQRAKALNKISIRTRFGAKKYLYFSILLSEYVPRVLVVCHLQFLHLHVVDLGGRVMRKEKYLLCSIVKAQLVSQ